MCYLISKVITFLDAYSAYLLVEKDGFSKVFLSYLTTLTLVQFVTWNFQVCFIQLCWNYYQKFTVQCFENIKVKPLFQLFQFITIQDCFNFLDSSLIVIGQRMNCSFQPCIMSIWCASFLFKIFMNVVY